MIEVVCGVLRSIHGVLAVQRGDNTNYGKWEFPGGKVKENESHKGAITREIKEELNLEIEPGNVIYSIIYNDIRFYFIECYIVNSDSLQLREHLDYMWLKKERDLFKLKPIMPVDDLFLDQKMLFQ